MTLDDRASFSVQAARPALRNPYLLGQAMDCFSNVIDRITRMRQALADLAAVGDATAARGADRLAQQLDAIEPSVTFIGQVKAGKTSLINSMAGWPGLLPADVNPWTSVVTAIHLTPAETTRSAGATFRFFDQDEWTRLVEKGGRLGELASRAGAEEELEKVRRQVERMREKSQGRLGRRFEMLLGQEHRYAAFDEGMIERYVCLGDDFEDDSPDRFEARGRFADITKAADLFVDHAEVPLRLCLRDTPGVNDTFLMREQITIGAIRDSRLCVLVLSAHQALSTVDMALIRLIANVKAREIIVFVNRIDELADPSRQTEEIRDSIRATLRTHNGPAEAPILFGSAVWARHALSGTLDLLPPASREALAALCAAEGGDPTDPQQAWDRSGVPALYRAIAERIGEGIGNEVLDRVARSAGNLARGVNAARLSAGLAAESGRPLNLDTDRLKTVFDAIEARAFEALQNAFATQSEAFRIRLERSHHSFLDRATKALITHLEQNGTDSVWTYEPSGLRMLLRSACQLFGTRLHTDAIRVLDGAADDVAQAYRDAFKLDQEFTIDPAEPPRFNPPVAIAQTIALDIKGTWWRRWWLRRRGYQSFAADFYNMIKEETAPMVDQLQNAHAEAIRGDLMRTLGTFLDEQRETMMTLAEKRDLTPQDVNAALGLEDRTETLRRIENAMATMRQDAA